MKGEAHTLNDNEVMEKFNELLKATLDDVATWPPIRSSILVEDVWFTWSRCGKAGWDISVVPVGGDVGPLLMDCRLELKVLWTEHWLTLRTKVFDADKALMARVRSVLKKAHECGVVP